MRDMNNISFLKDKILNYINELRVEFHDEKTGEKSEDIIKNIKENNIKFVPWH